MRPGNTMKSTTSSEYQDQKDWFDVETETHLARRQHGNGRAETVGVVERVMDWWIYNRSDMGRGEKAGCTSSPPLLLVSRILTKDWNVPWRFLMVGSSQSLEQVHPVNETLQKTKEAFTGQVYNESLLGNTWEWSSPERESHSVCQCQSTYYAVWSEEQPVFPIVCPMWTGLRAHRSWLRSGHV